MFSMKRNVQNKIILGKWNSYLNWIESKPAVWRQRLLTVFLKNSINFPFPACELQCYNFFFFFLNWHETLNNRKYKCLNRSLITAETSEILLILQMIFRSLVKNTSVEFVYIFMQVEWKPDPNYSEVVRSSLHLWLNSDRKLFGNSVFMFPWGRILLRIS